MTIYGRCVNDPLFYQVKVKNVHKLAKEMCILALVVIYRDFLCDENGQINFNTH